MSRRKRKRKAAVRTGLPTATWRLFNTDLDINVYSLKDMIQMYSDLNQIACMTPLTKTIKEITQARNIIAKHILNATKPLKRIK